jgi:hypothetical protein
MENVLSSTTATIPTTKVVAGKIIIKYFGRSVQMVSYVSKKLKMVLKINSGIEEYSDVTVYSVFSVLPGLPTLVTDLVDIFVARIKSLGNYPDGDLEEIDFPQLAVDLPVKPFKIPRAIKTRMITRLKESRLLNSVRIPEQTRAFLPILNFGKGIPEEEWHTTDTPTSSGVDFADRNGVELTCPL